MQAAADPNRLMREAEAHFVADRFADALPLVEQVLGIVPGHPAVRHAPATVGADTGSARSPAEPTERRPCPM